MTILVVRADARRLPLPDASVDLVVSSPPFLNLRSYTDGGRHYERQIGVGTREHFLEELWAVTAECARVLKPSGSMFIELGDSYSNKSLNLTPERYRIGCVDRLGLLARAEIVWSRPNGLPESVTDRVRRSHSSWVHLVKQPRYFAAVDEIRTPAVRDDARASGRRYRAGVMPHPGSEHTGLADRPNHALGSLPGSVWEVATEPLQLPAGVDVDHFAAFATTWPKRLIQGWAPRGVCADCAFLLGSSYDYGMLGVRQPNHRRAHPAGARANPRDQEEPLLHQGLRDAAHGPEQSDDEVPAPHDSWLRGGLEAEPSDGTEERLRHGASARDGRAPRPDAGALGGRAPQERDQDGQPSREPGTAGEGGPRPAAKASTPPIRLPSLRRHAADLRDSLACPHCGSGRIRPSLIVDPFGGTGTTAHVAAALGRTGISVDLSADYCRLAAHPELADRRRRKVLGLDRPVRQVVADGQLGLDFTTLDDTDEVGDRWATG